MGVIPFVGMWVGQSMVLPHGTAVNCEPKGLPTTGGREPSGMHSHSALK